MKEMIPALMEAIDNSTKIAITTHFSPDGDAIGSSMAMYHYLKDQGKEVKVLVPSAFPDFLAWLDPDKSIVNFEADKENCLANLQSADLIFSLDYGGLDRVKSFISTIKESKATKIIIDHHPQPEDFADITIVETASSSTCQLLLEIIDANNELDKVTPLIANALYTGVVTDTGRFKHSLSPELFHAVSKLIAQGATPLKVYHEVFDCYSEDRMRFLGYCISEKMQIMEDSPVAIIGITTEEFERFNYQQGDSEGIVNYPLSIKGILAAVLVSENKDFVKLSFRSKGDFGVNELAKKYFNGGGHFNAAGGRSYLKLNKTIHVLQKRFAEHYSNYKSD